MVSVFQDFTIGDSLHCILPNRCYTRWQSKRTLKKSKPSRFPELYNFFS